MNPNESLNWPPKKILMATDFTVFSEDARDFARDLCRRFQAELHLLHVIPDQRRHVPEFVRDMLPQNERQAKAQLKEQRDWSDLKLWEELFPNWRREHEVVMETVWGEPYLEILQYAKEHAVDLIAVGTHGRTGWRHWSNGSVAERVVRKASCPVLTIRSAERVREFEAAAAENVALPNVCPV